MIDRGSVDRGDGALAYWRVDLAEPWRAGAAPPLVCQHGLGLTSEVWLPWLPRLAATRQVVAIDLRGHGGSAAAWGEAGHSIAALADDVEAVLAELGIGELHFLGESVGGTIGLELASRRRLRIRSLSLCSTGFRGDWISGVDGWRDLLESEGVEAWSRLFLDGRFAPGAVPAELVAWVDERQRAVAPAVANGIVAALKAVDLGPALEGLDVPLLTMNGVASPFVDLRAPRTLRELVPLSEAVFLRDGRHGIVVSHWRECSALVADFVARAES